MYISHPRGDRKFGGCFCLGCLGGEFCVSLLRKSDGASERARRIELARCRSVRYFRCPAALMSLPALYRADLSMRRRQV